MKSFNALTAVEQFSNYLREEIIRGSLTGAMPGVGKLAEMCGVSQKTVIGAVRQLEHDGLLESQGPGRRSQILLQENQIFATLRIQIFLYHKDDLKTDYMMDLLRSLQQADYSVKLAKKTLCELEMDPKRVARFVKMNDTDAWIVQAGSREVLEWFSSQALPAFALFGRRREISMPSCGPNKIPAQHAAIQRLIELGHRKIVCLARKERREPHPGLVEQAFLDQLKNSGIKIGTYNLPQWENNIEDFHHCIETLFKYTPPTALIVHTSNLFVAAQLHLARLGILAPEQISLICTDFEPIFDWCQPAVTHIRWRHNKMIDRIVQWAKNVSLGKDDYRKTFFKTEFVEGGSIGPVPRGR